MTDEKVGQFIGILIAVTYVGLVVSGKVPADAFGILAGMAIRHFLGIESQPTKGDVNEKSTTVSSSVVSTNTDSKS